MQLKFLNIGFVVNNTPIILLATFVILALSFSCFYGFKSIEIFVDETRAFNKRKMKISSWEFHMFWINFVCSLLGWATLFYIVSIRFTLTKSIFQLRINFEDVLLIFTSVFGISGVLGHLLSKISSVK